MIKFAPKLEAAIDKNFEKCKAHSDYITDNPELGMEEKKACAAYQALLENAGFKVEMPYRGVPCSFRAVKKERVNDTGKKAVLVCEYDALEEIGHACGHSMSGSASVLAALALYEAYPDLPIRIDLMGTPGEEHPGGKKILMQEHGRVRKYV
jgi:metal-dependent amidase/aminoacylase/carboxypeptidase family protein